MTRPLKNALVALALCVAGLAGTTAPAAADSATQNADTASRIRNARAMSTSRAVQAAQEKRERAIQAELARINSQPPPPPPAFTIAAGGAVITAPVSSGGPALGQGLVVNNTTLFVNIQNGEGNVASNTLVVAAAAD